MHLLVLKERLGSSDSSSIGSGPVALDFLQQQLPFGVDYVSQLHDCLQLMLNWQWVEVIQFLMGVGYIPHDQNWT